MINSVYLDTSVFGGYFDKEFSDNTVPFFDRIIDEQIQIFVSRLLIAELAGAPDEVRELLNLIGYPENNRFLWNSPKKQEN